MLKIPSIPNPFTMAFSSYKMTNMGKVVVGSMLAKAAMTMYNNQQSVPMPSNGQGATYSDPIQETWAFYGKTLQTINNKSNLANWWSSISKDRKQNSMIEIFCKEGKGHLVPYLQQHIFPTIS